MLQHVDQMGYRKHSSVISVYEMLMTSMAYETANKRHYVILLGCCGYVFNIKFWQQQGSHNVFDISVSVSAVVYQNVVRQGY